MRYDLFDFQSAAAEEVLKRLSRSRRDFDEYQERSAFALSAMTGAGKTVIAAAVLEALFFGASEDYEFEADPTATVLWLTDSPSLNEQTRFRVLQASDRLLPSRLRVIDNRFNEARLRPGTVHFLNTQLLRQGALLTRGPSQPDQQRMWDGASDPALPDTREHTFWDTLGNTVTDLSTTLYLVLDEAHRGIGRTTTEVKERGTIVSQIINGEHAPAVPVVWGISATVQRFQRAMEEAEDRTTRPAVEIAPADIQASGLLKSVLKLDFPAATGGADLVLLARGVQLLRSYETAWNAYTSSQGQAAVFPLLVVQVPNTPSDELMADILNTIRASWPEYAANGVAHVFGDHSDLIVGDRTVPYISPELVQDRTEVRILLAKDAISTGWDCPRAEVLVSFRPADDPTHITQILGRMVRSPLARPVGGDENLNSVHCLLPRFNRTNTENIAAYIRGEEATTEDGTGGLRVLIAPVEMTPNADLPAKVFAAFEALPSQALPQKSYRPLKRLALLTQALARDELEADAVKNGLAGLFSRLNGLKAEYADRAQAEADAILTVAGTTMSVSLASGTVTDGEFSAAGDRATVDVAFAQVSKRLSRAVTRGYAAYIAEKSDEDFDDALQKAELQVAALGRIPEVAEALDARAEEVSSGLLATYRVQIKGLSDARRGIYGVLLAMARDPQHVGLEMPSNWVVETANASGPLPTNRRHLLSDEYGDFPVGSLKGWERTVVRTEMKRDGVLGWYRNPTGVRRPDAFRVAYKKSGTNTYAGLYVDFLFFHGTSANVRASIVDPHGFHLGDALDKLRGLADFAEAYGSSFHRIESIADIGGKQYRLLDLTSAPVRAAIRGASSAEALFRDETVAADYVPVLDES
jgi:type III restriction enzyme